MKKEIQLIYGDTEYVAEYAGQNTWGIFEKMENGENIKFSNVFAKATAKKPEIYDKLFNKKDA